MPFHAHHKRCFSCTLNGSASQLCCRTQPQEAGNLRAGLALIIAKYECTSLACMALNSSQADLPVTDIHTQWRAK